MNTLSTTLLVAVLLTASGAASVPHAGPAVSVAPVASFTANPTSGAVPLIVQFTDTSTNAPTTWAWDFDDDGTVDSTMQNPIHAYVAEDLFTVTLTVTNACGSDSFSSTIDTRLGLATQFGGIAGWTNGAGFYFDVNVTNPAGLTVTDLGVQIQNPGVAFSIDVYIKTGTHVGNETSRNQWSFVSSGAGTGLGTPNETNVDVSDFSLAAGQWAMVIVYNLPAGERFNYTTTSATMASNADLALSNGANFTPAFDGGTVIFQPRNWNGAIYYQIGPIAGSLDVLGDGCAANSTTAVPTAGLLGGGVPTIGQSFAFEVTNAPVSQPLSFVVLGFQGLGGVDLGVIGAPGCPLFANPTFNFSAPTDMAGVGSTLSLALGNDPSLGGVQFFFQALVADPGTNALGVVLSNATVATIGS